jgi:hypothetical protein
VDSSLQEKKQRAAEGKEVQSKNSGGDSGIKERQEERGITLRPLNMEDLRQAKNQVKSLSLSLSLSLSHHTGL